MQHAGTVLRKFIREYGLEASLTLSIIQKHWENLVGKTIAQHTSPDVFTGKTLSVTVDTPQWMHHLSFYKQDMYERLKQFKIHKIRFRLGKLPEKIHDRQRVPDSHLSGEDVEFIEETIRNLKDEELKERFRTLLTHALGRGSNS
jgi:predicted nucleic acid-binding Zn ribbon protein